ncbi:TonB-dependent receptor [Paraglaciecola sp. L3A3]|uniref:TonB-dependent receptor n=1 Tax=Paraglaciecola sp. L3A3 TaxID=2686358 RepID=UPI00131BEEF4|nr:TonB-dependent receptor [Paraglaciecola sp. L3A3]
MLARFKLKPLVLAMIPVLCVAHASSVFAQSQVDGEEKKSKEETEVIEVTGFRGSLQKSIAQKRLSDSVTDSIFSEDIGKSTDQNIADALSRVTGVTVQESDGEGTRISVRGAGASLNQVSLNGVALTSSLSGGGGSSSVSDQSVDLSTFSSDILAEINVVKTSAADHDEGSLGANVILRTVKPLNIANDKRIVEVQGRYNEFADETDRKFSGTFSKKFFDETFGFIITASDETQATRSDSLGSDWLTPYEVVDVRAGGATSLQTGLPTTEATKAIIANGKSYATDLNFRKRKTVNTGFQFLPTEDTDIQLDLSYSKQVVERDSHRINIRKPDLINNGNYVEGDIDPQGDPVDFTDPQELWWTVDESNHTIVKALNRNGSGGLGRNIGGNETENKVATLTIEHLLTDDLSVSLKAGYSSTNYNSLPNASLSTAHWNTVPVSVTKNTPLDILEPVGYDCTTGQCQMVVATQPFIFAPDGNTNGTQNIASGGFNPLDPHAQHLANVSRFEEETSDTNKSVFLDFDYDVDFAGVHKLEFGAKWSNRVKDVYTDYQTISGAGITLFDPETGLPLKGESVGDISFADVTTGTGLPVDDFMEGLIPGASSGYNVDYLKGWGLLDPNKAFAEIFQIEDAKLRQNETGSRVVEQDNISLYAKVNFSYMDDRLTGNLGLRYVKTENSSFASPVVNFFNGDRIFDGNQLIYDWQLANSDLAQCLPVVGGNQGTRIDGTEGIPNEYPCYEPYMNPEGELLVTYDDAGNVVSVDQNNQSTRSWWWNYRHTDPSTQLRYGESIFGAENETDIFLRTYSGADGGESSLLLPSLNLNYAISDELIGRFATSKTMARPAFDDMRPGFSANETVWGDGVSRATVYNPDLQPLESTNFDLSLEWYFDKTGLLSLAYFRKDMKNFSERVNDFIYWLDIRDEYERESLTWGEFAIPIEEGMTPQNSDCMPYRIVQDSIKNPINLSCDTMRASIVRNGKGNVTQGVEFNYSQDFSFLPGVLSGLGTSFNYTYANSENDAEILELTGRELKALPQAYTPKHSANTTIYWEKDGHQIRLAHRYKGIQLVNRGLSNGAEWLDASTKVDFSASYKFDKNITFSFHALNLTDETSRTFFTSTEMDLGMVDAAGLPVLLDEGNAMDGDADTSRTIREWKTGRQFRLTARINF